MLKLTTWWLMLQSSFVSSLVPLPLVPCLLLTSPLPFSVCFPMDTSYVTVTFLFENLLTQKGNLLINCMKAFIVWIYERQKVIPDIKSWCLGKKNFKNIIVGESLLWTLGFALCLQAWFLIPALGLQIPALLPAWRMNTIVFYCRFLCEQMSVLETFCFV